MDQYKEFCRLRDYRAPGAEVCAHTEAEAFALATTPPSLGVARERSVIGEMPANMIDAALDKTDPTQVNLIKALKSTESEK